MQLTSMAFGVITGAALLLSSPARANLVNNGGFETGDFTGWTQTGDTGFSGVQCPGPYSSVQSGNCSAFFGPVSTLGGISQTLATTAGATYDISFWLQSDGISPVYPSQFIFNWNGGAAELSITNISASGYTEYVFHLLASSAATSLSFSFFDPQGFLLLDSVAVNPAAAIPEPATLALTALAMLGLAATRRRLR